LVANSETVALEVRDRFRSELVVSTRTLTRFVDYDIDLLSGTISFREPILSRDADLNPQFIVIDYDLDQARRDKINAGLRADVTTANGKLRIGASAISDTAVQEQGIVAEHIFLMEQAMGLGGGIHSVGSGRHLLGIEPHLFQGLGFQFEMPVHGPRRPNPVGLPGIWEAPCPPLIGSMEEAVLSLIESKFGSGGIYMTSDRQPWNNPEIKPQIPRHSEQGIAATIAFCEYVIRTYGRFPAHVDAFKSIVACQAHHLDLSFYDRYYPPSALSPSHHEHVTAWHDGEDCRDRH
jgi:hypothetical protein